MEKKYNNSKIMQEFITYGGGIREQKVLDWLLRILQILFSGKKEKFNRGLPVGELLFDRWEKAKSLSFGEGTSIYDSSLVLGNVLVGKNTWIGPFTILDGSGGLLIIGDYSNISAGVHIYTHDTVDRIIYDSLISCANVSIGHHCYIGPNAVISKGVKIGDYVVIGANSFVNKDIPSYSKAFGIPAQVISKIQKNS